MEGMTQEQIYTAKQQPKVQPIIKTAKQIKTKEGLVSNINQKKILTHKNKIQIKKTILSSIIGASMLLTGIGIGKAMNKPMDNTHIATLNSNKVVIPMKIEVNVGETLFEIVDKYYNEDYENIYGTKENFINSIALQNQINPDILKIGQELSIPIIVDKDNQYLQNVLRINTKIQELEENEKWIKYTVRLDDNLSMLAGWGSGNPVSVSVEEENEIARHNNLQTKTIYPGQELEIINPKIGNLKIELRKAEQEFKESLINNQKTK